MMDGPTDQPANNQPTNGPTEQWVDIFFDIDAIDIYKKQEGRLQGVRKREHK